MRGLKLYWNRKNRLIAIAVVLTGLYFADSSETFWAKHIAEDQVAAFLGNRFSVSIGEVKGGIFKDMVLQNVSFRTGEDMGDKVFRVDRMEVSYRLWWELLNKAHFWKKEKKGLKHIAIFFSEKNPFIQGFISFDSYHDKVEVLGHVSPVLFNDRTKRAFKGAFIKQDDGKYNCDLLWDGRMKIEGVLDPSDRSLSMGLVPVSGKKGYITIEAAVSDDRDVEVYSRLDKVDFYGTEIIGDIWITYSDVEKPLFGFKAQNLVVNKGPIWDFSAEGSFLADEKAVVIDEIKWGEGLSLKGRVSTQEPYVSNIKLSMERVNLLTLEKLANDPNTRLRGDLSGNIEVSGPANSADVNGRIFIKEGVLGEMEFNSLFATLSGKYPVIKVTDARAVKNEGNIVITGEIDFSNKNNAIENLLFDTDNKVAVWEDWQISKEDSNNVVEANRDRVTVATVLEGQDVDKDIKEGRSTEKDVEFRYKIDKSNSLKMGVEEEDSFIGVEHKLEF